MKWINSSEEGFRVCEDCLESLDSRGENFIVIDEFSDYDLDDQEEGFDCDFCGEEGFDYIVEIELR